MERESAQTLTPEQEAEFQRIFQEIEQTYLSDGKLSVQEIRAIVQLSQKLAPVQSEVLYRIRQAMRERWGQLQADFDE